MSKGRKETTAVLLAARASNEGFLESAIASSPRPVQPSWRQMGVTSFGSTYQVQVYETHLPATLIFLRIRSIALSETPSCLMVAFTLLNSRPSYEMLCSVGGIPDLSQGKTLSLGDTRSEATHFGLEQSHYVHKFHIRIDIDGVGCPQIRHES